jgi:hypothetical protein
MKFLVRLFQKPFAIPLGIVMLAVAVYVLYSQHQDRAARREKAQHMIRVLSRAIEDFRRDYDFLPTPVSYEKDTDCISDTSDEESLVWLLMGHSATLSIRSMDYLDRRIDEAGFEDGKRIGGIIRMEPGAEIVDPWGGHFKIMLDLDYNDRLNNPDPKGEPQELSKRFLIWSAGPDRNFGTWADNIISWASPSFIEHTP